jgi:hypothetical protein
MIATIYDYFNLWAAYRDDRAGYICLAYSKPLYYCSGSWWGAAWLYPWAATGNARARSCSLANLASAHFFRGVEYLQDWQASGIEHYRAKRVTVKKLLLEVRESQRQTAIKLRNTDKIDDEVFHRIERELDLEEQLFQNV